ncbi:MAG: response regulator [Acidobacteriota bacterium]|nr:response regulator [Acidobacteriota bacterium]
MHHEFEIAPSRVLIVDDERQNRQLLEVMLKAEGYEVTLAANGADALAAVASSPPDLILLDIMMPEMDGFQVTAAIKTNVATRSIPVILVTALDDRDARLQGLKAGAEDFLSKPVDRVELTVRVRNLLRLKSYGDFFNKYSATLEREAVVLSGERVATIERHGAAMRASEDRINYALEAARMGVWDIDMATKRLTWSDSMAPIFGLTQDQIPASGDECLALIHPDDQAMVEGAIAKATEARTDYQVEFRVIWPDGSLRWMTGRGRMICAADGTPERLIGVGNDITDRKSLEAQLRQSQKMEAVGQLAGGVAHDFNNLLTAILGYSNFVIDTLEPADERREDMEEVIKAGHRAAALTRQLLAFSRKQVLQPTSVDLNEMVNGMRQMLSRLIGEHVDLVATLAPELGSARADLGQLEQVLMNLALNARDAMPDGGRLSIETADVELDSSFAQGVELQAGRYVMLAVSDSGVGMDGHTKQRLFEPFFTTKDPGKGTGLGLATVYGIVKQSGGYIWVSSEPGKGASFKVYLPREDAPGEALRPNAVEDRVVSGTESILVVEDEAAVRLLTCRILERAGYQVIDAPNPKEAEALFEKHEHAFSLLISDVIMPGSSGPAMFARLARKSPSLRVLYVSGYTDDMIVRQGELLAGVEFLQKPFTATALTRTVRDVLDRAGSL